VGSGINSYKDMDAWKLGYQLGLEIYKATKGFPDDERFGLVSQLRRGGISIPSNIAEGFGRGSKQDYVRFLRVARGSLNEVETQLMFAGDLGYLAREEQETLMERCQRVARVLGGLIRSLA